MSQSSSKGKKGIVLRRTVQLPASLRTELEELGQLPKSNKGKTRKQQRQQQRQQLKQNRAQHRIPAPATKQQITATTTTTHTLLNNNKRKPITNDDAADGQEQYQHQPQKRQKIKSVDSVTSNATSIQPPPSAPPTRKQTALERMLEKQQRQQNNGVDTARPNKSKAESVEDREIAWLEAKLGIRGQQINGTNKDELADDGLDDLFDDIGQLESAAFGRTSKDYERLLRQQQDSDDDNSEISGEDDDDNNIDEAQDDFDNLLGKDDFEDDSDESAFGSDGISDEELRDPGDDDDHEEMLEPGSEPESDDPEQILDESDLDSADDMTSAIVDMDDAELSQQERMVRFAEELEQGPTGSTTKQEPPAPTVTPAPSKEAYVLPHLRRAMEAEAAAAAKSTNSKPTPATSRDSPPSDPRLRRQLMGHLNKLSSLNIGNILTAIEGIYSSHPRAVVSAELTSLLLEIISGRDNLGEQLVVNYAALVAALSRFIGVELPAGVVAKSVGMLDDAFEKNHAAAAVDDLSTGFEGRPGSKECENIVAFIAEMYNFQIVACVIVYDLVKQFIQGQPSSSAGAADRDDKTDSGSGMGELEVELLAKIIKRSGQQLRQDDPSALKQIIDMVRQKQQGVDPSKMNSRTRFMIDSLTNLKNNKIKPDANGAVDNYSNLKKFLVGLKKRSASVPEPLRITLSDLRSSDAKGKWWLVGAAWAGDSATGSNAPALQLKDTSSDAKLAKLARAQGMNTDIRKGVFTVLMSSEDYVDACERLLQLGLSDVQQREIARVLLQCCGNEKAYNPYYTLVAHRMASKSHGFQITLQYCLWDFLRELGEKSVGGQEMVKTLAENDSGQVTVTTNKVSSRRARHLAKLYAWCVAKDVLSLAILKPVPFGTPKPQTISFLTSFFSALFLSTQTPSPALILSNTIGGTRRDKEAIERVFIKAAPHGQLVKGLAYFFEASMSSDTAAADNNNAELDKILRQSGERERKLIRFGIKVAKETLSSSTGILVDL